MHAQAYLGGNNYQQTKNICITSRGQLLLGLSAVIDLVVAAMNFFVLSCQDNRTKYENPQLIQLSHTYVSSTIAEDC